MGSGMSPSDAEPEPGAGFERPVERVLVASNARESDGSGSDALQADGSSTGATRPYVLATRAGRGATGECSGEDIALSTEPRKKASEREEGKGETSDGDCRIHVLSREPRHGNNSLPLYSSATEPKVTPELC